MNQVGEGVRGNALYVPEKVEFKHPLQTGQPGKPCIGKRAIDQEVSLDALVPGLQHGEGV